MPATQTENCPRCGDPLPPQKPKGRRRIYCSDACQIKAKRKRATKPLADPEAYQRRVEYNRAHRIANRARYIERKRQYRLDHPEQTLRYAWRQSVHDRVRTANRRAAEFGCIGRLTAADVEALFETQPTCVCGAPSEHMDHIRALADGGLNLLANLQALCARCHGHKSAAETLARAAR